MRSARLPQNLFSAAAAAFVATLGGRSTHTEKSRAATTGTPAGSTRETAARQSLSRRERRHDLTTAHGPAGLLKMCVGGRNCAAVFLGGISAALLFSLTGCGSLSLRTSADSAGAEVAARLDYAKLGEEFQAAIEQVNKTKNGGSR